MKPEEQAKNAIQWIDTLPNYKQAPKGKRGRLGNPEIGFCCLGAGCFELGIEYDWGDGISFDFQHEVGLFDDCGIFKVTNKYFYGKAVLTAINDHTHAGFKRIAKLLKTKPHWMFEPEVAELIKEHYEGEK
jgi:hypothetical protein